MQLQYPARRGLIWLGLLVGFTLRLYRLGTESLWYDETVSVYLSRQQIPDLIAHTARDIHPPGYYLMLHLWQQMADPRLGHGLEFLFAWPSVWFGMLLLPLIFAVSRRLFNEHIAVLALWLTAVHPYHIWYSQEVRMYTFGAALGLLCLWAVVKTHEPQSVASAGGVRQQEASGRRRLVWLVVYGVAAAAGLYSLYYFAFLLIALNLIMILQSLKSRPSAPGYILRWVAAQVAVFLLWLPWAPTFWRQITDPPVPAWRTPVELIDVVRESLAALLVGQSPPPVYDWIWVGVTCILLLASAFGYTKARGVFAFVVILIFIFVPLLLIYLFSQWLTPLYHIRYFFLYAALAPLLLALGIAGVGKRWWSLTATTVVLLISGWSTFEFWTSPDYRADDHRSAVAELAAGWRPGDAILVNAGWIYPILETYWPRQPRSLADSVPAPLVGRIRLPDFVADQPGSPQQPVLITTGSVDGPASLGWGLTESDFYAMAGDEAQAALHRIAIVHPRIWHYRLYDTVSDPAGTIRATLATLGDLQLDLPYPGRDFLRVQRYESTLASEPACPAVEPGIGIGDALTLRYIGAPQSIVAGHFVYVSLCWQAEQGVVNYTYGLRTSLRLYPAGSIGESLIVQADTSPPRSTAVWQPGNHYWQPLALPIAVDLEPGQYVLALVVYNGEDGVALTIDDPGAVFGQILPLSEVTIQSQRRLH